MTSQVTARSKCERGANIRLTEQRSVVVRIPLDEPRSQRRGMDYMSGMVIVESWFSIGSASHSTWLQKLSLTSTILSG